MTGPELAQAAEALVGTPFRLHGRDPATGLDCVGLLAASAGIELPRGYRLRMRALPDLAAIAAAAGFGAAEGAIRPGDVLMARVSPCQFHLLVAAGAERFVHAHAGLGRVVHWYGPLEWPVVGRWRLPETA